MAQDDELDSPAARGPAERRPPRRRPAPHTIATIAVAIVLALITVLWRIETSDTLPTAQDDAGPPPIVEVVSVPPEDSIPLAGWTLDKAESGYIERVTYNGAPIDPPLVRTLKDEDAITLIGWAGDTDLGMRFQRVAFTMCERIVGDTPVSLPRADIARQVHPNLAASGWSAALLIGHLPRCDAARLAAWAVAPYGKLLFPLRGSVPLALGPSQGLDRSVGVSTARLAAPGQAGTAGNRITVEVRGQTVSLRRCGDLSCTTVGALGRGKHAGLRLDGNAGWTLVLIPDRTTGWISNTAATIAPVR